ncbi:ATP synthase subunit epsilon, mitochondrial [Portunus trituberculatus]|uniref:ATP synthase subunit epsilon, mitochondrial n=1 Tax=Portunus trituberculatus TaxID=210409 RepID=A0A5B7EYU1_PORTR|nr:ATP synthase subunit epsilon, mitochondrial [Portunus trituberculatus]
MTFWRAAGLNYAQYSVIAARALRQALKEPTKSEALKRDGSLIKIVKWKDGKAISKEESRASGRGVLRKIEGVTLRRRLFPMHVAVPVA